MKISISQPTFDYTKEDVFECFNKINLKKGDNVFVNPELFRLGVLKNFNDKKKYFKLFIDLIFKKIGKEGTVSINSYTFQTLRYNKPFIYEKTEASSGGLSEYFRNLKGAVRSDHPVFSVTSKGKNKNFISKNNSQNNYGAGSPYERFLKLNGKILNLGMDFHLNAFLHHIEFIYSVPYFYNKLTRVKYFKNQKKIKKDFISSVRYYDLEYQHNLKPIIDKLKNVNFIQSEQLGKGYVHLYSAKKYCEVIKKLLDKNVLTLVKSVKFQKGKYPYK